VVADGVKFMDGVEIAEAERAKIYCENAQRIFRLT
jgi:predicted TIM-barrel fold metal-dependent hydrolase